MQIVDHQIERGLARQDPIPSHQEQVGAAAHLVDADLRPVEDGPHAELAHEAGGLLHPVGLQHHMGHANRRSLLILRHLHAS
ncbi:hypothetical protein D3C79_981760 [compost metagenome]